MSRDQKIVAAGAAAGILAMLAALFALSSLPISLPPATDSGERLAFTAKWMALAAAPLFVSIVAVGNARFGSRAIDPTARKESKAMIIDGRVVDNTLQQYVLLIVASLAVGAASRGDQLSIVAAAAIIFVFCRFAFWVGYRINPLYRAFGFASTIYLNLILLGVAMWRAWA